MLICLLNDLLFPCPRTHALHVRKLAEGFIQRGYHFKEIKADELRHLSEVDVVYISNHFSTEPLHRLFRARLQARLMELLHNTSASLVLWNFHTTADWDALKFLKQNVLHLGEDMYAEAVRAEPVLYRFRSDFNVLALRYAAPFHPELSTLSHLTKEYEFNFVGHGYQRELTRHCEQRYKCLIRNTPPNVSEALRVNSFRRAQVNLVFHAPSNINKGIVVERFAEALSMGGIIFHDHPRITAEFPDHPAFFYVSTPAEIDQAFAVVMGRNAIERDFMRTASWQSWKQAGLSYFDQAGRILAAFKNNAESGEA
jgi:hypothetical protein